MTPLRPPIAFATSNANKILEAERLLGVHVVAFPAHLDEIQSSSLESITSHKLETAMKLHAGAIFVEDVALGFDELGGFPGPYIKWLLESAGGEGLAAVATGLRSPRATAACCVAFWDGVKTHVFRGETRGMILPAPRGSRQFGWDAWFQPDGWLETYGEMSPAHKDAISHRAKAYEKLRRQLLGHD